MDDKDNLKKRFETVSKGAFLDIILPQSPPTGILSALKDDSQEDWRKLPSRRNLFFGMEMNERSKDLDAESPTRRRASSGLYRADGCLE